jgi:hypothetical protein
MQGVSFCTCIPPDDGQYVWPKHVEENKPRTYGVDMLRLCGLYLLLSFLHLLYSMR